MIKMRSSLALMVDVAGENMELLPQKVLYWPAEELLLIADLHLGKINHFRRAGIPVPSRANDRNIELLIEVAALTQPKRIVCLGDLFHSHYNTEWEVFGEVVRHLHTISFELVLGNHDIMSERQYERKGVRVFDDLRIGKFLLTHHPLDTVPEGHYNLAGHVHPSVRLVGKGRQAMTLPCFYFGHDQGFLPAFGMFTGTARIRPKKNDRVVVVAENRLLRIQ